MPLANASKISRIYGYSTFPLLVMVNIQLSDIGKPDIYRREDKVSRQPIVVIFGHPDKKTVADLPKLLC